MKSNNIEKNCIVAISNPRSGRNKRGGFEGFEKVLRNFAGIEHIVTNSVTSLIDALNLSKQKQCKVLIVNGGDGTLLHILTYMKKAENLDFKPELVLLKAGTTSMAYGDVGCKGKLIAVLNKIVKYSAGDPHALKMTTRCVLKMSLRESNQTICGMFFGGGVIYNAILYCRQNIHTKGIRGEFGPSMAMIRYLFDWLTVNKLTTSTRANIQFDQGNAIEGDFTIITATTLKRLLMGVFPFWGQSQQQSFLSVSLIRTNPPKPARAFLKILSGKAPNVEVQENYYRSVCTQQVTMDIYDGFTLDGELYGQPNKMTKVILESAGEVAFLIT